MTSLYVDFITRKNDMACGKIECFESKMYYHDDYTSYTLGVIVLYIYLMNTELSVIYGVPISCPKIMKQLNR